MKLKLALAGLVLTILACTAIGAPLPAPESASIHETEAVTSSEATAPPATFLEDRSPLPTFAAPTVSPPNVTSLSMFNELEGWAISENAILRTIDGGTTWYNVSPQGVTAFGFGAAHAFLNASQAWVMVANPSDPAGSGMLYRTGDGGLTWTVYPVYFGSGDMTFIDQSHGWMLAPLGIAAGSMAVAIYTTDDGGASWTQTYTNDPNLPNTGESLPMGGLKNNLTPLDEQTAWIGGVIYSPETFYFFKTSDGGRTWNPQILPTAPGMQNTEVAVDTGPIFLSQHEGILPIRFSGETLRTGFYVTRDGGVSWEFVAFMPGAGPVDFVSPSDGFFWTGEQLFVTSDGAQTWTSVNSDILFGVTFAGMDFVNPRTGWVRTFSETGQFGLYKTTDGGATWDPIGNE